jgi:hypothetical protein
MKPGPPRRRTERGREFKLQIADYRGQNARFEFALCILLFAF